MLKLKQTAAKSLYFFRKNLSFVRIDDRAESGGNLCPIVNADAEAPTNLKQKEKTLWGYRMPSLDGYPERR